MTYAAYGPVAAENTNTAEFCDPAIDREVDRDLTWQAPWVSFANGVAIQVKSVRVGNYQYNPRWRTLLDQLWVRGVPSAGRR